MQRLHASERSSRGRGFQRVQRPTIKFYSSNFLQYDAFDFEAQKKYGYSAYLALGVAATCILAAIAFAWGSHKQKVRNTREMFSAPCLALSLVSQKHERILRDSDQSFVIFSDQFQLGPMKTGWFLILLRPSNLHGTSELEHCLFFMYFEQRGEIQSSVYLGTQIN